MAGTTNILIWDPPQTNQVNDAGWAAYSPRANGAVDPNPFPSQYGNKLFNQLSTVAATLCAAMAAKGFTLIDSDPADMQAAFAAIITTGDQRARYTSVAYAGGIVFDVSKSESYEVLLTGDTIVTFINGAPGLTVRVAFLQDGVGGRAVTWPVGTAANECLGAAAPNADPGAMTIQKFWVAGDGTLRADGPATVTP